MTTIEWEMAELHDEIYYYLSTISIENYVLYEVEEDENGEKNMEQLLLGSDDFDDFFTEKFLQKVTNDYINSPCFDVADNIDLDIISVKMMSYMIEYLHNTLSDDYGQDERLTDYSVESVLRQYTYFYARRYNSSDAQGWFEDYYSVIPPPT